MARCDTVVVQGRGVMEQVAQDLFDIMPEEGLTLIFVDREGDWWSNRPDAPLGDKADDSVIRNLMVRIDDGDDPAIVHTADVCVVASQLSRDHMHWGYLLAVLPKRSVDSTAANLDLVELILRLTNLLAQRYREA